jgi:hypothetical protein
MYRGYRTLAGAVTTPLGTGDDPQRSRDRFPPEAWFEDVPGALTAPVEGKDLAARIRHLFETIVHPRTGEPYTSAEVARLPDRAHD